ncbi:MAG: hypothetical protein OEV42_12135, partial [Deltaproteobacteria bacterium]|nr:hypothetical protein [Deltaproteobacteria bacterium]
MEDNCHMVGFLRKFAKKIVFIVCLLLPFFLNYDSHAIDKIEENHGVLDISLLKRIKEPFEIESYKVILDGKVVLRNVIGDKELYGTTIDNIPAGSHKILVKAVYSGSGYGINGF